MSSPRHRRITRIPCLRLPFFARSSFCLFPRIFFIFLFFPHTPSFPNFPSHLLLICPRPRHFTLHPYIHLPPHLCLSFISPPLLLYNRILNPLSICPRLSPCIRSPISRLRRRQRMLHL